MSAYLGVVILMTWVVLILSYQRENAHFINSNHY